MSRLLTKFTHVRASLREDNEVKFAFELAKNAMALPKTTTENCAICFEETHIDKMFLITSCLHSYCFSCMSKHVKYKLLEGKLPKCPHEKCDSNLKLDSCKKFPTCELFHVMSERVKEASIPPEDKMYCPNPTCSALLSKTEVRETLAYGQLAARKCQNCRGIFCMNCIVPWHANSTCYDYKKRNPYPSGEDEMVQYLATKNLWRQCPKCSAMVSLARGCYHIYCRCGHEFCYKCGAKWRNKKPTCTCPIWDEHNIVYRERNRHRQRR